MGGYTCVANKPQIELEVNNNSNNNNKPQIEQEVNNNINNININTDNILTHRKILIPKNNKEKKAKIINKIGDFIKWCRIESNKRKLINEDQMNKKQKIELETKTNNNVNNCNINNEKIRKNNTNYNTN